MRCNVIWSPKLVAKLWSHHKLSCLTFTRVLYKPFCYKNGNEGFVDSFISYYHNQEMNIKLLSFCSVMIWGWESSGVIYIYKYFLELIYYFDYQNIFERISFGWRFGDLFWSRFELLMNASRGDYVHAAS